MTLETDNIDYRDLATRPRLFALLCGWSGQTLLANTCICDSYYYRQHVASTAGGWDECARELTRLAAMVQSWFDARSTPFPASMGAAFSELVELYAPGGRRDSAEAIRGPVNNRDPRWREPEDVDLPPPLCSHWPDLLDPADGLTGQLAELISRLRRLVAEIGSSIGERNALSAGAALARYATGPWLAPDRDRIEVERWVETLVNLGLLANPLAPRASPGAATR
jgi:hypothetical protein